MRNLVFLLFALVIAQADLFAAGQIEIYELQGRAPKYGNRPQSVIFNLDDVDRKLSVLPPYRWGEGYKTLQGDNGWPYFKGVIGFESLDGERYNLDLVIEELRLINPETEEEYELRYWVDNRRESTRVPRDSEFSYVDQFTGGKTLQVGYLIGVEYRFNPPIVQTDSLLLRFRFKLVEKGKEPLYIEEDIHLRYREVRA